MTLITRRELPISGEGARQTLDTREHAICSAIVECASQVLRQASDLGQSSLRAITDAFDENVVASYLESHYGFERISIGSIFDALRTLSEQSYENKALTFGCILDPSRGSAAQVDQFPEAFLDTKKYKALSDGFRTAYHVSSNGGLLDFVDLEQFAGSRSRRSGYYPVWAEPLANASTDGRCGIALSRQGDILVFDDGILRFTYRYGKWQYWNHAHLISLLQDRARAQHVPPKILGNVVGTLYRAALDVSFRRSGALFVVLHNRRDLRSITRRGDGIGDSERAATEREFDKIVGRHKIQGLRRAVIAELASLDGAVVIENSGGIRAYGAVLQPKRRGQLRGTEGSRTKAAIGASNYGLAIKVSSDGDITVYHKGREFIRI